MDKNETACPWKLLYYVAEELYNKRRYQQADAWKLLDMAHDILTANLLYNDHGLMNKVGDALVEHDRVNNDK